MVKLPGGFPRRTLKASREIYRIHRSGHGPWWFSDDGSNRFDPVGTGFGACYFAEEPLGAWVEVFRTHVAIEESDLKDHMLFSVSMGRDLTLADLTSRRALQFGVTASVGADRDYSESQAFAARAVESGFDGLRYLVRHDPAQRLYGLALFGKAGRITDDPAWPAGHDRLLPPQLAADAVRAFRYRLVLRW